MIVKNYRNFFLWIALVAVLSVAVSFLVPSGPVNPRNTTPHPRGATVTAQVKAAPGANTAKDSQAQAGENLQQGSQTTDPASDKSTAAPAENASAPSVSSPLTYPRLRELMEKDPKRIKQLVFEAGSAKVIVKRVSAPDVIVYLPDAEARLELRKKAEELNIDYDVKPGPQVEPSTSSGGGFFSGGFMGFLLMIVIGAVVSVLLQRWLMGRMQGGGGGNFSGFGKSRAKDVKELGDRTDKVTFDDVAGCDEAVAELRRVVKSLIERGVYADFDGELPKGVLLLGPPGTGKTLLAKAVANECNGTMKALSGSDFVEMLVGVGAARVRDEFALARKTVDETKKPYVIFIDEFDAIGGKRGREIGGNSERENTLNQLLVEMDGVHTNHGILVIAATNRADMLDDALLRPGRFDAHISVDLPDILGREKIFIIHTRKKRLAADVTPSLLAQRSFGYSGAEIKGACNRAAIVAAERWMQESAKLKAQGKSDKEIEALLPKEVRLHDFDEGIDFVRLGAAKNGSQARMSEDEKLNTAFHEGGHALTAAVLKGADPVVKITMLRRSRALGYVQYMPNVDRLSFSDEQAIARIICAMAGRKAQEVYLNRVDTGASNDFEQACNMAQMMVTKWGMSKLGRISVGDRGPGIAGYGNNGSLSYGQNLADEIDAEWRRIVAECEKIALYIVESEKTRMHALVNELMKSETILAPRWNEFLQENPSAVEQEKLKFNPAQ